MDKKALLDGISKLAGEGRISRLEILSAFDDGKAETKSMRVSISQLLYFLGGLIVVIGIGVLINQNWDGLNDFTRILSSLGSGIAAYFVGIILNRRKQFANLANSFFLISAIVIPIGLHVVFHIAGFNVGSDNLQILISALSTAVFFASWFLYKKQMFLFFVIAYFTWLFFAVTNLYFDGVVSDHYEYYRFLAVGVSYCFLARSLSQRKGDFLSGVLYGFGSLFYLSAALLLTGDSYGNDLSVFWTVLMPFIALGTIFLSVSLRTTSFLVMGTIFLILWIFKTTADFFADALGWPLALVIIGLLLMALGFVVIRVHKKYLAQQ